MKPILLSLGSATMAKVGGVVLISVILLLLAGCASSRRQRDYAKLYRVVPGEEQEDFARLVSWVAERDGNVTLPVGGRINWAETTYYRWYSNETFVVLTCPPRFHESRSSIKWVCGSVQPVKRGVGWTIAGDYRLRGPGTYDFPGIDLWPEKAVQDGVFGVRFGDGRDRLLKLQEWHVSDQPEVNKRVAAGVNGNPEYDRFGFGWLRGHQDLQMHTYLTHDRRVAILYIQMPSSPTLAGLDFMGEDPPVLRQGSFVVDEELAAKGRKRMQLHNKSEQATPRKPSD